MATAVERPFSALEGPSRGHSTHPSTPEVIDVDLLDDDDIQIVGFRPPPRPVAGPSRLSGVSTPETISLLDDSDEEVEPGASSSTRPVERRRLFSPPPPRNVHAMGIPPVPRLPSRYSAQASMVPRQRASVVLPPPPIRASDRDFDFNPGRSSSPVAGPSRRQPHADPAPQAAPRSHHVPSMGLGGAIISSNNARVAAAAASSSSSSSFANTMRNIVVGVPHTIRRTIYPALSAVMLGGGQPAHGDDDAEGFEDEALLEEMLGHVRPPDRFRQPLKEKDHYKPYYTHPAPAEPGFTHDFAPSDDPGERTTASKLFPPTSHSEPIVIKDDDDDDAGVADSSSATVSKEEGAGKMTMLLVCARCQDPLILNSGLVGADRYQRKIWALRCGHMLDGKCLAEIAQPAAVVDRKGKGKAKEEVPYGEDPVAFLARSSSADGGHEDEAEEGEDEEQQQAGEDEAAPEPSIRSRLRSRASGAADAPKPPPKPSRKRKRAPAKSATSKRAKIEDEFEWECPVASCGRVHASMKINGGWGPEKERPLRRGAVASLQDPSPRGPIQVFA